MCNRKNGHRSILLFSLAGVIPHLHRSSSTPFLSTKVILFRVGQLALVCEALRFRRRVQSVACGLETDTATLIRLMQQIGDYRHVQLGRSFRTTPKKSHVVSQNVRLCALATLSTLNLFQNCSTARWTTLICRTKNTGHGLPGSSPGA